MKKRFLFALLPLSLWADSTASVTPQLIDMKKIFVASPLIYGALILMSIASMSIWIYTLATFRSKEIMPESFRTKLKSFLEVQGWEQAKETCVKAPNLLSSIIQTGLITRDLGPSVMIDAMKMESKRASTPLWQRLSLLN